MERLRSCAEKLSSTDVSVQEHSLRYLINGSTESSVQTTIFDLVGSKKLKELLQSNNEVIQMLSTWLLSHLCLNHHNSMEVIKSEYNLVDSLIELLQNDNQDVIEKSLWVLTNLTLCAEHSYLLVEHGVVHSLINNFLKKSNHSLIILACQPLRNLMHKDTCAEYLDNQKTFCHSGTITNITKLLSSRYPTPSNDLILSLSSIIHVLTIYHPLIRRIISISGVLYQLISFLSSPSSPLVVKEQVVKILINLSLTEETEKPILDSGAIMPLIDSVASVSSPLSLKALSISCLANLTANEDIRRVLRSKVYYNPLVVAPSNPPILSEELVEAIFSNIDQIFRVNCEFLKKLRSISSAIEEADVMELSQAFQWLWDQQYTIPEYRFYINGFNRALDLIHENRTKLPRFKEFLDKCQFSDQCKSETLESYLIRPEEKDDWIKEIRDASNSTKKANLQKVLNSKSPSNTKDHL
ncbi:pleckstrin domain-containing protein [Heterostelium album PN500]|uniref:Pleckstrin domain-containing protein n=1 Tax=Heterostelium pallidum (strain ATCC 26659 / Pp 5 / PN500) TaxID=670386 RepID=D3BT79_HETP5|nr:pleckstrin domain-containing protein [Heterostelium album PN500]EFA75296.1 pleckstrin domain-containing protein [Heterostelium album PN500]|eukprot:XP_020427430.1 pleckstrin domain-containing protein [Heterostelium album PN500]